jgi:hypothetical protein
MASLQELNQYTGNAALAAGTAGNEAMLGQPEFPHLLDAVDKFTAYSMQMNRDLWVKANQDMQERSAKAAQALDIHYGDLIPKDKEEVVKSVKDLYDQFHQDPTAVVFTIDPKTGKDNRASYEKFMQKKQALDYLIVRGNLRAHQVQLVQDAISKKTDQKTVDEMNQDLQNQILNKPIGENFVIPADIAPFNSSQYASDIIQKVGQTSFDYLKRYPDFNIKTTETLFNTFAGANYAANDLYGDTPVSEDLKKDIAQKKLIVNGLISKYTNAQTGVLDKQALAADPLAVPILAQLNARNQQAKLFNTQDVTDNAGSKRKVRDLLGYSQDIPQADISNLSDMNYIEMMLAYKSGKATKIDVDKTNLSYEYWAKQQELLMEKARLGKEDEKDLQFGQEKFVTMDNLLNAPTNGLGTATYQRDITQTIDRTTGQVKATKVDTQGPGKLFGYEIGMTPQLQAAFALPKPKTTEKNKEVTPGAVTSLGTNAGYDLTEVTTNKLNPTRIFVIPDPSLDPNKAKVHVRYEDNTTQTYGASQISEMLNGMYGDNPQVKAKVAQAGSKWLTKNKLTQPNALEIHRILGENPQQNTSPIITGKPLKKPRPY